MAVVLLKSPPASPFYSASEGPQGNFAWEFNENAVFAVAPTFAQWALTVTGTAALAGSAVLGGATVIADATITGSTATRFQPSSDARVTAQRIADALRANVTTAGKWNFTVSGTAGSATLTAVATEAGVLYSNSTASFTPTATITNTPANVGAAQNWEYFWQLVHVATNGAETPLGEPSRFPISINYRTITVANAFADAQRAAARMLSAPYPGLAANVSGLSPNLAIFAPTAIGKYYLRFGTVGFTGCKMTTQNILISEPRYVIDQAFDVRDEFGTIPYSMKLMSLQAYSGMCIFSEQDSWFYARVSAPISPALIAVRITVFDEDGVVLSQILKSQTWLLTGYDMGVIRAHFAAEEYPTDSAKVKIEIGTVPTAGSTVFTQTHDAFEAEICDGHCIKAEIHFRSSVGGWESVCFKELLEVSESVEQSINQKPKPYRDWQPANNNLEWSEYANESGEAQRNTKAKLKYKLKAAGMLPNKEGSMRLFEELLRSEDRKLVIKKFPRTSGQPRRIVGANIISLTSEALLKGGLPDFEIEIQLGDNLATLSA